MELGCIPDELDMGPGQQDVYRFAFANTGRELGDDIHPGSQGQPVGLEKQAMGECRAVYPSAELMDDVWPWIVNRLPDHAAYFSGNFNSYL